MNTRKPFSKEIIFLENIEEATSQITGKLQQDIQVNFKRNGAVIGISGGIDSSVCLALSVKAFGADKVVGIIMPEKDSSPDSEELALELAGRFGIRTIKEVITGALDGFKCYDRRDEAVKRVFPEYDPKTYKMKIGIRQSGLYNNLPPLFTLSIIDDKGVQQDKMLHALEYLQIVAASNFKQRSRMSILYYHAEALHYAVVGTPNKHEQEQGFFVKHGDGAGDVLPIGNLYKTQVYQLPFRLMDIYWYGFENGYAPHEVADVMGETDDRVDAMFRNFERKRKTTEYLRMPPVRDYFGT